MTREARLARGLLALIVLGVLVSNALWLHVDRSPSDMDQGRYMLMVKGFADGFEGPDAGFFKSLWLGNHPSHPHLVPLLAAVPFTLFGHSQDAAFFVVSLFFAGVIVLVFLLGERLSGPRAGLVAAVLAAGFPLVSRFSRFFLLEEAAAFAVVLVVYCLVRSRGYTDLGWAAGLGVAVGIALLIKWTTLAFIGPALLVMAAASLLRARREGDAWRRGLGIAVAAAGAAVVAGPWYVSRWETLSGFFRYSEEGRVFAGEGAGAAQLGYYLDFFWLSSGWMFTAVAVAGLIVLLRRPTAERLAILSAILAPLAVFSFLIETRDLRHLLPAFPLLALAAGLALVSLRPPILRRVAVFVAAAVAVLSIHQSAWGFLGEQGPLVLGAPSALLLPAARPPDPRSWGFGELLAAARKDHDRGLRDARRADVTVVAGNLPFRPNGFAFLAAERFPSLRISLVPFFVPRGNPQHRHLGVETLLDTEYLMVREGDINGNLNDRFEYSKALQRYVRWSLARGEGVLRVVLAHELPNGVTARVLRIESDSCDRSLFDFLDWAHEADADDPGVPNLVAGCASASPGDGSLPWREMETVLEGSETGGLAAQEDDVRRTLDLRWPRRLVADALVDRGRLAAAARLYEDLGVGTPYSCSPLVWAGIAWKGLDEVDRAREALGRGVADTPDCVSGHLELAGVLRAAGEPEGAALEERIAEVLARKEGAGLDTDTARYRITLGDLALRAGRRDEAVYHYREGLRSDPADESARKRLDGIRRAGGDPAPVSR